MRFILEAKSGDDPLAVVPNETSVENEIIY